MRIPSKSSVNNNKQLEHKDKAEKKFVKNTFSKLINNSKSDKGIKAMSDMPISQQQLRDLANDYNNGVINDEQANKRFIQTIVDNSLENKLGKKHLKSMASDIENICKEEPGFVKELCQNLKSYKNNS